VACFQFGEAPPAKQKSVEEASSTSEPSKPKVDEYQSEDPIDVRLLAFPGEKDDVERFGG